jgi:hypothetical protein
MRPLVLLGEADDRPAILVQERTRVRESASCTTNRDRRLFVCNRFTECLDQITVNLASILEESCNLSQYRWASFVDPGRRTSSW